MHVILLGMGGQMPQRRAWMVLLAVLPWAGCWALGRLVGEVILGRSIWIALGTGLWAGAAGSMLVTTGYLLGCLLLRGWLPPSPGPWHKAFLGFFFIGL